MPSLAPELRAALELAVDGELKTARRLGSASDALRGALVEAVRRFVQRHGLAAAGYRFESSLADGGERDDALAEIVRAVYDEGGVRYEADHAAFVVAELAARGAL